MKLCQKSFHFYFDTSLTETFIGQMAVVELGCQLWLDFTSDTVVQ